MANCPPNKIDSNVTGARYAKERCLGQLPPSPTWYQLEPNSYSDLGGQVTTVARNPINQSRQRKKGVVTNLEASGGLNQDITLSNTTDLLQGFVFAAARERGTTKSLVRGQSNVTAVVGLDGQYEFNNVAAVSAAVQAGGTGYRVGDLLSYGTGAQAAVVFYVKTVNASTGAVTSVVVDEAGIRTTAPANPVTMTGGNGTGATLNITWGAAQPSFSSGDIVLARGFNVTANNGIKTVDSYASGVVTVVEAVTNETPTSAASLQVVGHAFGDGELSITMNGLLPRLTNEAAVNLTDTGIIPGEWVYLHGFEDNRGFARVSVVTADYLEFDKVDWIPVAEAETGITVKLYYGTIIKNEQDPALIVRTSYQIERTLGQDANGTMSEYLIGAVANELTLNVTQAEKVTVDISFMAIDNEQRDGTQGVKAGARPSLLVEDAFNTSSDFSRIKMAIVSEENPAPVPLFSYATDLTLTINNNVSANKAIGVLGAFDVSAGTFEVGGSITAYFSSIDAVRAVRDNEDITLDFVMVKNNTAMLFDVPLLALGNGRLNVEQDQAITIPLDTSAAENKFGNTLTIQVFHYIPAA